MSITVNGKTIEHIKKETISDLLKRMHYTFPLIIVKINGKLIKKKDYNETVILDKSEVKVIHLISGG
ncbi:MAG: sulfur carrier protein ThiS [Candidatus Thermoplasmatota archaeon]|nr:sulfur carrier protein ThiS [Candidatus Thermoplasmatota archaeon]MBS3801434.1 sulfur carrier protein ThiS [Candidatus Thermoplasmatota archaeon]